MQGSLEELDIRSLLHLIEVDQRTGILLVTSSAPTHNWVLFFVNGQIVYGSDSYSSPLLERAKEYLFYCKNKKVLQESIYYKIALEQEDIPEYRYVWALMHHQVLSINQGRNLLKSMLQETMFDIVRVKKGEFVFSHDICLEPLLISESPHQIVSTSVQRAQKWHQLYPHICSHHQYPVILNEEKLQANLPESAYKNIVNWARNKTTLRKLSRYINKDLLSVSLAVYPYAHKGWIELTEVKPHQQEQKIEKTRKIVCFSNDLAIASEMESLLRIHDYKVTILNDPLQNFGILFDIKPQLIFSELELPRIGGAQICKILRNTEDFKDTPIIILLDTSVQSYSVETIQTLAYGATGWLKKPFKEAQLWKTLEKYVRTPQQ